MPELKDTKISTRAILIAALAFNFIAIGLSEVQRGAIFQRSQEEFGLLDQRVSELHKSIDALNWSLDQRVSEFQKSIDALNLNRRVLELQKSIDTLQWSLETLQIRDSALANMDPHQSETQISSRLSEGKEVVLQFDRNAVEDRDEHGNTRCGERTDKGYLGIYVAAQRYTISYDKNTRTWTGTGPRQDWAYDPKIGTCGSYTAIYGPKEIGADVQPGDGNLILWGTQFKLKGHDVLHFGQKVGTVGWLE